ncbi:hypothetical protein IscW_ISCW005814 [Ixodes scapularis]|uniref:E3 ubiquitin-protein ligase TTC3/DZIP3 domain-containing protein n=1 Tax=Ixodes scapularis TaxID=6945 RepID=B7PM20_IXOSC|nr:hypothetical protein IscW_ISCW005814 [Ixodes scapularis]|eukprot:XP_002434818.1 hypothetical protein IscW_ISCW005814 [Ixodes scapularis]
MQAECRSPPERDAMCCREECPLQRNIYYSDPDFRGFQQLHCHSRCLVQYHPACWKEIRDARSLTEKVHAPYLLKREEEEEDDVVDSRPKKWKRRRPKNVLTLELDSNDHL